MFSEFPASSLGQRNVSPDTRVFFRVSRWLTGSAKRFTKLECFQFLIDSLGCLNVSPDSRVFLESPDGSLGQRNVSLDENLEYFLSFPLAHWVSRTFHQTLEFLAGSLG